MRLASLATVSVALVVGLVAGANAPSWSAPATIATCAPAVEPRVVFPSAWPNMRSGRGAILWLGGVPHCGRPGSPAGATLDIASLHSDDRASVPRPFSGRMGLVGPLATAWTSYGQLVAALGAGGGAAFGEGEASASLSPLAPLGSDPRLVATADGYISDADLVSAAHVGAQQVIELRPQRHYERTFERPVSFAVGPSPVVALAVGMDFRADSIVLWAQNGVVYARWITNDRRVHPVQTLGPAGYDPQLAAVLSDNDHAFVLWTAEPAPGASGTATIYVEHSGGQVTFTTPSVVASFPEPAGQRLTPGAIGLERLAPSEGVLAAWTHAVDGYLAVSAAGLISRGLLTVHTIAVPGIDVRLAALAAGPHDDVVAVLEEAPRASRGFDETHQAILAARSAGIVDFGTPVQLAPPGVNSAPSVAIDPANDAAVVAWQTTPTAGLPQIAYAVRGVP